MSGFFYLLIAEESFINMRYHMDRFSVFSKNTERNGSQIRSRDKVSHEFKWDLTPIYASDTEWKKEKSRWTDQIKEINKFKGKLSSSAEFLLQCVQFQSHMQKEFSRLYSYASMKSDEDIRKSRYIEKKQELEQLHTEYATRFSFFEPEIATIGKGLIDRFIRKEPGLKKYRFLLFDILRRKNSGQSGNDSRRPLCGLFHIQ
jgi:oligoendopeptidase F